MYKALDAELSRFERHVAGLPERERDFDLYWYTREVGAWTHRGEYQIRISRSPIANGALLGTCWFEPWTGSIEHVGAVVHANALRRCEAMCAEHNRLQPAYPALLAWPADADTEIGAWPCDA